MRIAPLSLALLCGCAGLGYAIKSAAVPATGAGLGALVGLMLGPIGSIVGAAVGAVVGNGLGQTASLHSGETVGDEALERLWRHAASAPHLSWYEYVPWFWIVVSFLGWMALRNAESIGVFLKTPGILGKAGVAIRGLAHALLGAIVTSPANKAAE